MTPICTVLGIYVGAWLGWKARDIWERAAVTPEEVFGRIRKVQR